MANAKKLKENTVLISTDLGIDYLYSGNYKGALLYLSRVLTYNLEDKYEDVKSKVIH